MSKKRFGPPITRYVYDDSNFDSASIPSETDSMASTLTPDDLQQWLQRTSLASSQKAEHSRVGLAGNLFETSLQLITSLLELARERNLIPGHIIRNCQNEIERYHLWGDGFGVADGDLDALLAKSSELRVAVISLLHKIGSVVSHGELIPLGSTGCQSCPKHARILYVA